MIAISCIQALYTHSAYNEYKSKEITKIERWLSLAIDDELHNRSLDPNPIDGRSVYYKAMEDMTPQELDSLLKIEKPDIMMRL